MIINKYYNACKIEGPSGTLLLRRLRGTKAEAPPRHPSPELFGRRGVAPGPSMW